MQLHSAKEGKALTQSVKFNLAACAQLK